MPAFLSLQGRGVCVCAYLGMIMRCERQQDSSYPERDLAKEDRETSGNEVMPSKEETKRT